MHIASLANNAPSSLPSGNADFLLAASVTHSCDIIGITQAGIPGLIPLTPTLDAELISSGRPFSLSHLATTPAGVPSPALITRSIHTVTPFSTIEILNLGLVKKPNQCLLHDFDITPSFSIRDGAAIHAADIFQKGRHFGRHYSLSGDYLILGESTPGGTTTAQAAVTALGFDAVDAFSSSFKNISRPLKTDVINQALSHISSTMSSFERLGQVGDNMLIFNAGFVIEASNRFQLILAGGTQMAACLLILDRLANEEKLHWTPENIQLCTTQWVQRDPRSDILRLLQQLSQPIKADYVLFDFSLSTNSRLQLYDKGEAKEGVGAGAAIAYGYQNGMSQQSIVSAVESLMASL